MEGQITGILSPVLEKIRLRKVAREIQGGSILDFGCGRGKLLEFLPGYNFYLGLDVDPKIISYCKNKYKYLKNVDFMAPSEFKFDIKF